MDIRLAPTEAERRSDASSRVAKYAKIHEMEFLYYIGESCPENIVILGAVRKGLKKSLFTSEISTACFWLCVGLC